MSTSPSADPPASPATGAAPTSPATGAAPASPATGADSLAINANNPMTVSVRNQRGEDTFFKVKLHTRIGKLLNAYANRTGQPVDTIRFLLDGERLSPEDTMESAGLENEDQIDAVLEQIGG